MMHPDAFRQWRKRHGMTQAECAECAEKLGFKDRRQIINYEKGTAPIPKYIRLATVGFDALARSNR